MQNEKRTNGKKSRKPLAVLLAVALLVVCAVGGTMAWLTSSPGAVTNSFTIGNINIELTEKTTDYKMIPGHTIDKDPVVTVKAGSEDCYVFVEVTEECGVAGKSFGDYIMYSVNLKDSAGNGNFQALTGHSGVYYCVAKDIKADRPIKILGGGNYTYDKINYKWSEQQVLTLPTVTKEMMEAAVEKDTSGNPVHNVKLTFTAYAVQYLKDNEHPFTPEEAWALVKPSGT